MWCLDPSRLIGLLMKCGLMPRLPAVPTAPPASMSARILTSRLARLHSFLFFLLPNVHQMQLSGQSNLKSNNAWTWSCGGNKKMLIWLRQNLITYSQLIKASEASYFEFSTFWKRRMNGGRAAKGPANIPMNGAWFHSAPSVYSSLLISINPFSLFLHIHIAPLATLSGSLEHKKDTGPFFFYFWKKKMKEIPEFLHQCLWRSYRTWQYETSVSKRLAALPWHHCNYQPTVIF